MKRDTPCIDSKSVQGIFVQHYFKKQLDSDAT